MIGGAFARALAEERIRYNALFGEARRAYPALDGQAFARLLEQTLAPLIEAVDQQSPERTSAAVDALYELSLDLLGRDLLGPQARSPWIQTAWERLLPDLARFVALEPQRTAGAVSNALYNLAQTPGARPQEWISRLLRIHPLCPDVNTLLQAGQVLAWLSGMAHYRSSALARLAQMGSAAHPGENTNGGGASSHSALLQALLQLPGQIQMDQALDWLEKDSWWRPDSSHLPLSVQGRPTGLGIAARIGAFSGFGGEFTTPPRVGFNGEHFIVRDGTANWALFADAFGACLQRIPLPTTAGSPQGRGAAPLKPDFRPGGAGFSVWLGGRVAYRHSPGLDPIQRTFPELESVTSWAASGSTLVVATALSHAVTLITVS